MQDRKHRLCYSDHNKDSYSLSKTKDVKANLLLPPPLPPQAKNTAVVAEVNLHLKS